MPGDDAQSKLGSLSHVVREGLLSENRRLTMGYLVKNGKIESFDGMHPARG
jgi:hypothetical protein